MTAKPDDEPDEAAELPEHLPLLGAFLRWADPQLIDGIRQRERRHTMHALLTYGAPVLSDPSELIVPTNTSWMAGPPDFTALTAAWHAAIRDFARRVQDGELHLEGVEFTDDLNTQPQAIPGTFAAKMVFDFAGSTLKLAKRQFLAVTVSRTPSAWAPIELPRANPRQGATLPSAMSDLTDEQIFELLEKHARRVIAGPDATLLSPGKISFMPLIAGKMRDRARSGELLGKVSHEAAWLADWIASKVTLHQVPTASTIAKTLGKEYAVLNPTSNTAIERSKP